MKKFLITILGIIFLVLSFWLIQAPKAEATDYDYLHIKIDSEGGNRDGTCGVLENCAQLWQFHGFKNLPHNVSGDGELAIGTVPAGYQCGIWLVEEWVGPVVDRVGILWTKAGNRLKKSGTSIDTDLADKSWDIGDGAGGPNDLCTATHIDTATLQCAHYNVPPGIASTTAFTYGLMDSRGGTQDISLSDASTTYYQPDTDILCAGTDLWKTCEVNDCAVIGANSWTCNGGTGVWTNCTAIGQVCNGAGTCAVSATEICNNGVDDGDPDLLADCADTADCPADTACIGGGTCSGGVCAAAGGITFLNPSKINDFMELVDSLINALFYIAIPLAILILVIAAFLFMTAGGEAQKVNTARTLVFYTLLGLLIIVLAKAISAAVKYAVS